MEDIRVIGYDPLISPELLGDPAICQNYFKYSVNYI